MHIFQYLVKIPFIIFMYQVHTVILSAIKFCQALSNFKDAVDLLQRTSSDDQNWQICQLILKKTSLFRPERKLFHFVCDRHVAVSKYFLIRISIRLSFQFMGIGFPSCRKRHVVRSSVWLNNSCRKARPVPPWRFTKNVTARSGMVLLNVSTGESQ